MITDFAMKDELKKLKNMTIKELQQYWTQLTNQQTFPRSKIMLRKKIAFYLQAEKYGDHSEFIRLQVKQIGLGQPQTLNNKGILVGTVFSKTWKDKLYRLVAVEDGFMLNGKKYKSLSGAAAAVAGSQWSGKVFWKVK